MEGLAHDTNTMRTADLETSTYLDGMITLLLRYVPEAALVRIAWPVAANLSWAGCRFLCASPPSGSSDRHSCPGAHPHGLAAEILQVLLSRGESEISNLDTVEAALLSRLYTSVQLEQIDLQNKMLHVLHTAVHATRQPSAHPRSGRDHSGEAVDRVTSSGQSVAGPEVFLPPDLPLGAFFERTVARALGQDDVAVVHHWLDFLLMTVPNSRYEAPEVLGAILDNLIAHLRKCVGDLEHMFGPVPTSGVTSAVSDAEFAALVNALERLLLLALAQKSKTSRDTLSTGTDSKPATDNLGTSGPSALFGYVTGVLGHVDNEEADTSDSASVSQRRIH